MAQIGNPCGTGVLKHRVHIAYLEGLAGRSRSRNIGEILDVGTRSTKATARQKKGAYRGECCHQAFHLIIPFGVKASFNSRPTHSTVSAKAAISTAPETRIGVR